MLQQMAEQEILIEYRDALLARFPNQLQRLILFGSQARRDAIFDDAVSRAYYAMFCSVEDTSSIGSPIKRWRANGMQAESAKTATRSPACNNV